MIKSEKKTISTSTIDNSVENQDISNVKSLLISQTPNKKEKCLDEIQEEMEEVHEKECIESPRNRKKSPFKINVITSNEENNQLKNTQQNITPKNSSIINHPHQPQIPGNYSTSNQFHHNSQSSVQISNNLKYSPIMNQPNLSFENTNNISNSNNKYAVSKEEISHLYDLNESKSPRFANTSNLVNNAVNYTLGGSGSNQNITNLSINQNQNSKNLSVHQIPSPQIDKKSSKMQCQLENIQEKSVS